MDHMILVAAAAQSSAGRPLCSPALRHDLPWSSMPLDTGIDHVFMPYWSALPFL